LTDEHDYTSSVRRKTTTPTSLLWVPKNCRPRYKTIIAAQSNMKQYGKEKRNLLLSCMEVRMTASNFYSGGRKLF
jgi:hypothetical protein